MDGALSLENLQKRKVRRYLQSAKHLPISSPWSTARIKTDSADEYSKCAILTLQSIEFQKYYLTSQNLHIANLQL
jgi:hypothetical protein